jgi:malonyl-CoA/methylmalonyl-CoA synthetase
MTALLDRFEATLTRRAADTALECPVAGARATQTFGDVGADVARAQSWLRQRGVEPGERVVAHLANGHDFIALFLACLRRGAILVPANVLYRDRELAHIVADATPRLVVTRHPSLFPAGTPCADPSAWAREAPAASGVDAGAALNDDAPAVIIYTSGTTGRAKGAVLSHGNLLANTQNLVTSWRITTADRYLAVLPLFHVHGLGNGVCSWLATGCRMRLEERFDHAAASGWFDEFQPTLFFGVPTIYVRMLEWDAATARRIGGRTRLFVSGSAPLPAHVLETFRERFGHVILERYGMSETLMNISNPYDGERRAGSVGVPLPNVTVRVVDDRGGPVGDGVVGQLEVQGPNVFRRYWANPGATVRAFRDGWFRTGDLAERSADGYYTLRGRASDLIISGGFNVYPREVEELLLEIPGVREAAVVGVPDATRGEVPVAYVVASGAVTDEELRSVCMAHLASFKLPRAFVRVDALPRTALGKVQKHLLPPWNAS